MAMRVQTNPLETAYAVLLAHGLKCNAVYESSTFGTRVDVAGGRIAGNAGRWCGADAEAL
jgi:hypothetical protein